MSFKGGLEYDSHDWQQKKYKGWHDASIKSGAEVALTEQSTPPSQDVIPDIIKARFLRTARAYGELPDRPSNITEPEATQTILRGLREAIATDQSFRPLDPELLEFPNDVDPLHKLTQSFRRKNTRKFMTLDDVHKAASRTPVLAAL